MKDTKRKIGVVTTTRAEYGLLKPLLQKLKNHSDVELQLIVSGSHLSIEFGETYKEIIEDGFTIDKKIEMLLSSDSNTAVLKSMGLAQISFAESFSSLSPDMIVVLGDRYELLPIVSSALVLNIPVAHLHGGEVTQGAIDESVRHAVTKMSQIHFPSKEVYRNRIIQMGENPEMVFNVGALGDENIMTMNLLSRKKFEESIHFKLGQKNILVTYHPVTTEGNVVKKQFKDILDVLDQLEDTKIIFTKANADAGGRLVNQMIDEYVNVNTHRSIAYTSLGLNRYLSALQFVDMVLGNSSSGIDEVPLFNIPTVNIGDRQKGRERVASIIDTDNTPESIRQAIETAYQMQLKVGRTKNKSNVSDKIVSILLSLELENIVQKPFFDLNQS